MKLTRTLALLLVLAFFGCTGVRHYGIDLTEKNATILMAKSASRQKGPEGISDKFVFDGKIFAYGTFRWDDPNLAGGTHTIDVKWYSNSKLVSTNSHTANFGHPPYHVWFPITVTSLGIGKGRVEFYSQGRLLGSKTFEIVAKEDVSRPSAQNR